MPMGLDISSWARSRHSEIPETDVDNRCLPPAEGATKAEQVIVVVTKREIVNFIVLILLS